MEEINTKQPEGLITENKSVQEKDSIFDMPKIDPDDKSKKGKFLTPRRKKILLISSVFLIIFLIISIVHFVLLYGVYKEARVVEANARQLVASAQAQNLDEIKSNLDTTRNSIKTFDGKYKRVEWMKIYPVVGVYFEDGRHAINASYHGMEAADVMIQTVEPYADIIGLKGNGESASGEETAKDRLDFVVSTISEVIPRAEELVQKVNLARDEIDQIDPQDYPEEIAGYKIRSMMTEGISMLDKGSELLESGKPLIEQAPYLLGANEKRTYLVLFQNDKELRPTGGFLTAYSIAEVEKGKFEPVASDDIYNLDGRYTPVIPAPEPIIDHIRGPYVLSKNYRLRDINWSPDFEVSMDTFIKEAEKVGIDDVDGIIAVDTQVLVNLLEVLGPIGVPGYGEFSNKIIPECNCPQVIYELESFADVEGPIVWDPVTGEIVFAPANIDNRKKIIGPLMNSILSNSLGQSKEKIPALFEAGFDSLLEKHVLLYLKDENAQAAAESFGIAGKIEDVDGDYLHINDANLGGRKSNLYVTQEVHQQIEVADDGSVTKTVTITYKNPEKHDGWLNSVLPNWVRVYVPKGSELLSLEGLEDRVDPYDELDKTVFAGFFELRPQGVAKVNIRYKLPMKFEDKYKLYVQKQPGKDKPLYVNEINGKSDELFLRTDKEFIYDL